MFHILFILTHYTLSTGLSRLNKAIKSLKHGIVFNS
jgi:hypothetical protein